MMTHRTDADLIEHLRRAIAGDYEGTAAAWAKDHDFSRAFISDVLSGRRQVTERLALALGYRLARLWERVPKAAK